MIRFLSDIELDLRFHWQFVMSGWEIFPVIIFFVFSRRGTDPSKNDNVIISNPGATDPG